MLRIKLFIVLLFKILNQTHLYSIMFRHIIISVFYQTTFPYKTTNVLNNFSC